MRETVQLGPFFKGENNVSKASKLGSDSLRSAINVDIDNNGAVFKQKGFTKIYAGNDIHSLYKNFFVEGSSLKQLNTDYSATVVHGGISSQALSYCEINGDIVFTDGRNNYKIGSGLLSIPNPVFPVSLTAANGSLTGGTYQVAYCFQNESTGELGGLSEPSRINISDNNGIVVDNIPQITGFNCVLYITSANGTQFRKTAIALNGLSSYPISSYNVTQEAETEYLKAMPAGAIIRYFNGRTWVADGSIVWYSEPQRYGLTRLSKNFFNFISDVQIMQPVTDGLFIVADKTYFINATGEAPTLLVVSDDSAVQGSGLTVGGEVFNLEQNIEVAYWVSTKGAVLGLPGGQLKLLTENRWALPEGFNSGTSLLKEIEGIKQILTSFNSFGEQSGFAFGDQLTTQIIRNGVVI